MFFKHALALYRAKIAGRNQYAVGEKLIPLDTGNKGETAVKLLMDETMKVSAGIMNWKNIKNGQREVRHGKLKDG